jgi:hypothetical protein
MRTSPVLLAVVAAIGTIYGCTLPLEGLSPEGTTSAGGAPTTVSGPTTSSTGGAASSTSTGLLECATQAQCPSDIPCVIYTCTMDHCVPANVPDGTGIVDDSGNCKKTVCMGGAPKTQPDPADAADGDPCTHDVCDGDQPRHDPGNDGDDCGPPGQHCFNGKCLECATPDQCPKGTNPCQIPTCSSGMCGLTKEADGASCASGTFCKNEGVCANGTCVQKDKADGTPCILFLTSCVGGECCANFKVCGKECCGAQESCDKNHCKP